jgi:hypothetical protein
MGQISTNADSCYAADCTDGKFHSSGNFERIAVRLVDIWRLPEVNNHHRSFSSNFSFKYQDSSRNPHNTGSQPRDYSEATEGAPTLYHFPSAAALPVQHNSLQFSAVCPAVLIIGTLAVIA